MCKRIMETNKAMLGCAVGRELGDAHSTKNRRNVDNVALATLDHARHKGLDGPEWSKQVDIDDVSNDLVREIKQQLVMGNAGIVD